MGSSDNKERFVLFKISCQYLHYSQRHLIYRYHIFLVSDPVNPNFGNCQNVSVQRQIMFVDKIPNHFQVNLDH
jgi:hypothetical protein